MMSSVYVIGEKPGGPVKVGYAVDPEGRRASMQSSNHVELRVLASCPGDRGHETGVHLRFADLWIRGEWFRDEGCQITRAIAAGEIGENTHVEIKREIAEFLEETGMSKSGFGKAALNNPIFLSFLGERSGVKFHTAQKIRAFIAEYRAAQRGAA